MVIRIDPPLPCAMYAGAALCGQPTTTAIITRTEGAVWELLPVCEAHLKEAIATANTTPPPLTYM